MATTIKPLIGVKVLEFGGLAPVPHCGLILSDFGAEVTVIEKKGGGDVEQRLGRGKKFIHANLKSKEDLMEIRKQCLKTDVILDPYRPGVLEKLGLDPVELLKENKGLVVCRLTGYGQVGAMSQEAGHDINYTAITGLLPTIAGHNRNPPWPPANLLADFAGGGLTAAFGIVAALLNRANNGGKGCIIDASMTEGLAYLGTFITMYKDVDMLWNQPYASFSGDCPIYRSYETKDGKFMSVGSLEPRFNQILFDELTVGDVYEKPQEVVKELERIFKGKTRDEWTEIFKGKDACVAPVLDIHEAGDFPHNKMRETFTKDGTKWIPNPAPRLYTGDQFKALTTKSKL
ncbi:unnamed protein product, partial [Mesorhabditis belari]|uniref:Alpha-methylacyl-CoA racemase n=1 Tax=Mesorhabditis belari TaxID=2138241 RepID=A0AAF3FIJ2_9BILA